MSNHDPISDKVLVIATLISLSLVGEINIYLTMFLLSRDLFIVVGVILSSLLIDNYEIKPYFSGIGTGVFPILDMINSP